MSVLKSCRVTVSWTCKIVIGSGSQKSSGFISLSILFCTHPKPFSVLAFLLVSVLRTCHFCYSSRCRNIRSNNIPLMRWGSISFKAFLYRKLQENNSSLAYLSKQFHWYSVHERKKILSPVVRQITPNVDFWRMPFFFKDFMRRLRNPNSYVVPIVTTINMKCSFKRKKSTSFRKHECIEKKNCYVYSK